MNSQRRKQLQEVINLLNSVQAAVEAAKEALEAPRDEEREYYDNMPESFQNGEKGAQADTAASLLEEVYDELEGLDVEAMIARVEEAQA